MHWALKFLFPLFLVFGISPYLPAQEFYFGNDLSYINEMEDCGVVYTENSEAKDPFQIFADHNSNLVRLRLWHTPSWYDNINSGKRYSDLADVKKSIRRARESGMELLLDFHLSDTWADPGAQIIPEAWASVVDDLPVLKDSLYNYIYKTLANLQAEDLLPEMVQIGNETNRGILLSKEVNNAGWVLDWDRNSQLFNTAIQAVRDLESEKSVEVEIVLHAAGPGDAVGLMGEFVKNGVTDFDIMGISYYWTWHQPTDNEETGQIVARLKNEYPGYEVMIVETGYPWTFEFNDNANNINNETHPDFTPPSPQMQKRWLVNLTQQVIDNGGLGVIYWEPAWVSSSCGTRWGEGSHYENATFFDFENNLLGEGGIEWMEVDYEGLTTSTSTVEYANPSFYVLNNGSILGIDMPKQLSREIAQLQLLSMDGRVVAARKIGFYNTRINLPELPVGVYGIRIKWPLSGVTKSDTIYIQQR